MAICLTAAMLFGGAVPPVTSAGEDYYDATDKVDAVPAAAETRSNQVITLPAIFADKMVFQRQKPMNVFGFSQYNGSTVRVTLGDEILEAEIANGEWSVSFPSREAAKGLTMTVEAVGVENSLITVKDIDIGELWLASGQSNASFSPYQMEDFNEYLLNADNFDNIRLYRQSGAVSVLTDKIGNGSWYKVDSSCISKGGPANGFMSAIGYVVATKLAAELGDEVTVGIINAARGSTTIKTWMSPEFIENCGNDTYTKRYNAYKEFYEKNGREPTSTDECSEYVAGKLHVNVPCVSYNEMIAHLDGFNIRGVIWYQGCGDSGNPSEYRVFFEALQNEFRRVFGNDSTLPFFVVQLAPYGNDHSDFDAMQYMLTEELNDTYVVSTGIEGSPFSEPDYHHSDTRGVHPSRKSPVGDRIASSILHNVYSIEEETDTESPRLLSATRGTAGIITLTFDKELTHLYGEAVGAANSVIGFELKDQKDGLWYPAFGKIDLNDRTKIVVYNSGISKATALRYGFGFSYIETSDGRLYAFDSTRSSYTSSEYTFVDLAGNTHIFKPDDGSVIRTIKNGNIASTDGTPLLVFEVSLPYTTE